MKLCLAQIELRFDTKVGVVDVRLVYDKIAFTSTKICLINTFLVGMDDVQLKSYGLYAVLCDWLGTESIVDVRRKIMALQQRLLNADWRYSEEDEGVILSGSECEGFRFAASDTDWMLICKNVRVIHSEPQIAQYHNEQTLLMAQCELTKPGFVLLRLIGNYYRPRIRQACVQYDNGLFLSSEIWRENKTSSESFYTTHGPCSTYTIGSKEFDHADCIKSDILPIYTHNFARRLHGCDWPSTS